MAGKKGGALAPSKLKVPVPDAAGSGATPPGAQSKPDDNAAGRQTSNSSRQIMENFITNTPPTKRNKPDDADTSGDNLPKRAAPGDVETEADDDTDWQQKLRTAISQEAGLTDTQTEKVMSIVIEAFKQRVVQEAKKAAAAYVSEEYDNRKSSKSVIIHRADQWVDNDNGPSYLNLAEKVTTAIHSLTGGAVTVIDAYALGRWDSPTPATAVLVTFGSRTQKTTFFKILARKSSMDQKLKVISCRDAFPKKYVHAAKDLAQRGSTLRTQGNIASFRIVARGAGCFPVLEVKGWDQEGKKEARWKVFVNTQEGLPQREGGARARQPVTPGKLPGVQRLALGRRQPVVPQPTGAVGSDMDIETIPLHLSEEETYYEPY